jgi:LPS O-antigen subunit length determinant protein (WzzB/FepE family)
MRPSSIYLHFSDTLQTKAQIEEWQSRPDITRRIVGAETAPTTSYKHLQGYVEFISKKSFSQVKNMIKDQVHWEIAVRDLKTNIQYCSKE